MVHSWDMLDEYRSKVFEGQWPSIPAMFLITLQNHADRVAFSTLHNTTKQTITYAQAYEAIKRIAKYLLEQGLEKGDRVVVNGKNSPGWALAYLATLFAGCVVVPLDNQMDIERVSALGAFSGARAICADTDVLDRLAGDPWIASMKAIVAIDGKKPKTYAQISTVASEHEQALPTVSEDDLAAILYTSGTTGNEKGAMLTHGNFVSDVFQACDPAFLSITSEDIFYGLLPLHHSYAMTAVFLESIKHGCELLFAQGMAISRVLTEMREGKVTLFLAIPLLYNKFLAGMMKKVRERGVFTYGLIRTLMWVNGIIRKTLNVNPGRSWFHQLLDGIGMLNIKICISGGGPLSPKTFRQYQQLGLDFVQGYGLTETAPVLTLNPIRHFKVDSVGKVLPLVTMRIADADASGYGEVQVQGPNICKGYYNDPKNTALLFTEDGFLHTGDIGRLDRENYLYLKGRAKNLIVTEGGVNVYPEEIEDAFQLYGQIDQIMVHGYLSNKQMRSEGVEAFIHPDYEYYKELGYTEKQIEEDINKIVSDVNRKLASYKKITKTTILKEPMAMTTTKKIQRNKVLKNIDSGQEEL